MQQTMEGTLEKIHLANETPKWYTYDLGFSDGQDIRILAPKDAPFDIKEYRGKPVSLRRKGDNWYVAYKEMLGTFTPGGGGGGEGKSSGGSGRKTNADYWADKFDYEVNVKDAQIGVRSLFIQTSNFYAACPSLTKGVGSTLEADALLDEAYSKAQEIFIRMNAKKDTSEV